MSDANSSGFTTAATTFIASAFPAVFAASGAKAASDKDTLFDDMTGLFHECFLKGGTIAETPATATCTAPDGQTTECDRKADDDVDPASCSTVVSGRISGRGLRVSVPIGQTVVAPSNRTTQCRIGTGFGHGLRQRVNE